MLFLDPDLGLLKIDFLNPFVWLSIFVYRDVVLYPYP